MAREKGTGSLQREKSGRYTLRVGINGKRLSRSTRTTDRDKAEAFLNRFLAPLGLGDKRLPLADVWNQYEMSPNRPDIAKSTMRSKRNIWMGFARWIEKNHLEITDLAQVTDVAIAEYLAQFRCHHSASTYNGHVCILREVFRVLANRAGLVDDPWADVCLRADDSISRRELTLDELSRLFAAAIKQGPEWKLLLMTGLYTGLRLGDCCKLAWDNVNLERQVIQVVPEKTKKHAHGKPVTIPIHPSLLAELEKGMGKRGMGVGEMGNGEMGNGMGGMGNGGMGNGDGASYPIPQSSLPISPLPISPLPNPHSRSHFVNQAIAEMYIMKRWQIDEGMRRIFSDANITMSTQMEGRCRKTVLASFHSLRHTFVSLSANAGVPLTVVQSIVGHTSTAMTRHYYHENLDALRSAVASIPVIGESGMGNRESGMGNGMGGMGNGMGGMGNREVGNGMTGMGNGEMGNGDRTPIPESPLPNPHSPQSPNTPNTHSPSPAKRLKQLGKLLSKGLISEAEYAVTRQRILAEI